MWSLHESQAYKCLDTLLTVAFMPYYWDWVEIFENITYRFLNKQQEETVKCQLHKRHLSKSKKK